MRAIPPAMIRFITLCRMCNNRAVRALQQRYCALHGVEDSHVAQRLAREHGQRGDPHVAAHESQQDGDRFADVGQEGEKGAPCPLSCEEASGTVELFFVDAEVAAEPFAFAQMTDPVAGHAACGVARGGCQQAECGVESQADEYDHHRFRTERDDAPRHEGREEKSPIAPVDAELRGRVQKSFHVIRRFVAAGRRAVPSANRRAARRSAGR